MSMIGAVMKSCNNWFEDASLTAHFSITGDGEISPSGAIISGQLIAITGSTFHDGVFRCTNGWLGYDEEYPFPEDFHGTVWLLKPPADFLRLVKEIEEFEKANSEAKGGYVSESMGEYSYQRATNGQGGLLTWREYFGARLQQYWRPFSEVAL